MCGILGFVASNKYSKNFNYEKSHKIFRSSQKKRTDICESIYLKKIHIIYF